jgi:hypothetical protein
MKMKIVVPWALAILSAIVAVFALRREPITILKEVPREIIREITKEVPVEVIKQIPVELSDRDKKALEIGRLVQGGRMLKEKETLIELKEFVVAAAVSDAIKDDVHVEEIKTNIELELRKLGLSVSEGPSGTACLLSLQIEGRYFEGAIFTYTINLSVSRLAAIPPPGITTGIWHSASIDVYHLGSYGIVGKEKVRSLSTAYEPLLKEFLNDYLAVNPIGQK